jgi:predicted RNA-binding Zn-ribbon protein involved in translation (DUF1610 family)
MPVFRATHDCGYTNEVFLKVDKQSVQLECKRCGKAVIAHQVRDTKAKFSGKDEVTGIFKDERR